MSTAYRLHGCVNLVEMTGFEALQGVESMNQTFMSCAVLETIHAATPPVSVKSGSLMFSGCTHLAGGTGYVPKQTDTHSKLTYDECSQIQPMTCDVCCVGSCTPTGSWYSAAPSSPTKGASCSHGGSSA